MSTVLNRPSTRLAVTLAALATTLAMAACNKAAKTSSVTLKMDRDGPYQPDIVPKFVEVRHVDEGWIRVPFQVPERRLDALRDEGAAILLTTTALPEGRYRSLRLGYHHSPEKRVSHRDAPHVRSGPAPAEEVVFVDSFCVDGDRDQLRITLVGQHPGHASGAPFVTVESSQDC